MLNDQNEIVIKRPRRARDLGPALRSLKRSGAPYDYNVKSATQLNIVLTRENRCGKSALVGLARIRPSCLC
jgi:hypothetical protein